MGFHAAQGEPANDKTFGTLTRAPGCDMVTNIQEEEP